MASPSDNKKTSDSTYTQGHSAASIASHEQRTVHTSAGFVLPHLKPHYSILDVGCGPGTITSGFVTYVTSGKVTGIDISQEVIEHASSKFPQTQHRNLIFEVGNVLTGLKYAEDSFDVVYLHQTILHLPDPIKALSEVRRVLKPGGFVALRDTDTLNWSPELPGLVLYTKTLHEMIRSSGAPGFYAARGLHGMARKAGFDRSKMILGGTATIFSSDDERNWFAGVHIERFTRKDEGVGKRIRELRLVDEDEIDTIVRDLEHWRNDQDGWYAAWQIEVIAFK